MKKKPRANKTKEQLLADLRNSAAFKKKIAFIKEKFYPALCEASENIEDATILLEGFNTAIMQEFLGLMKEKFIKDLKLDTRLDTSSTKIAAFKNLLDLFNDMSVFEAKDYIEGMRNEIDLFKREEFKARPLSSLQAKWIDEI